ncbi:MAG: DUF4080 domain-containing protein, partial [Pseudomonadota bacterium]
MAKQFDIVLATLNARYIHTSFGLRYLHANLGEYQASAKIKEFTLDGKPEDIVEQLLSHAPKIVGISVYIWNVEQSFRVVALLKEVAPQIKVVLGGPEVSYEVDQQPITKLADFVITGWGDISFYELVDGLLSGVSPTDTIIAGKQPKLDAIAMPYDLYGEDDIQNRLIYVEASRGCPYKCEFCLSALDKTAWPFDVDEFLDEMNKLFERGVRHFKFVDRTFNLKISNSIKILDFFLERIDHGLFLHFELIPDHLPAALKEKIVQFPEGSLQFEVGIQTFNTDVQALISRRQKNDLAAENLRWLRNESKAHIHADLIFGLPGETIDTFATSFDRLYELAPQEIQVGILKRLKGSPIVRHTESFELVFNPNPPFNVMSNSTVSFSEMQRMNRFARFWDMLANSGRFAETLPILLTNKPFARFLVVSDSFYARAGRTHKPYGAP